MIFNFVGEKGRRWARLAPLLREKRTEHMIKNRYHSMITLAKKILRSQNKEAKNEAELRIFFHKLLENKYEAAQT